MKHTIERRIAKLEKASRPKKRLIATWLDLMNKAAESDANDANGTCCDDSDVEYTPEMEDLMKKAAEYDANDANV